MQHSFTDISRHPELENVRELRIRQQVDLAEAIFSLEVRNRYTIDDGVTTTFQLFAGELSRGVGGLLLRQLLKGARPFQIEIRDGSGKLHFKLIRPFRFIFYRTEVRGENGELIGVVQKRFTWIRRRYLIQSASGSTLAEIVGPLLKPWTFQVMVRGRHQGTIRKRWSGLGKEMFTKADNFGVEFGETLDGRLRALLLGATFLIDFAHFERS